MVVEAVEVISLATEPLAEPAPDASSRWRRRRETNAERADEVQATVEVEPVPVPAAEPIAVAEPDFEHACLIRFLKDGPRGPPQGGRAGARSLTKLQRQAGAGHGHLKAPILAKSPSNQGLRRGSRLIRSTFFRPSRPIQAPNAKHWNRIVDNLTVVGA